MILYFSGTGNSEYIAKAINHKLNIGTLNLFNKIREQDCTKLYSNTTWLIVTPTYAWRIPRILQEWIEKTPFTGNSNIYFVMTCGGNIGNAEKYLKALCSKKNLHYLGCISIVMPENYIALYSPTTMEEATQIIKQANHKIAQLISPIENLVPLSPKPVSLKDKINSGLVNDLFYPLFVHSKKFYVKNNCINCELCVNLCPLENITIINNYPTWNNQCTHCMACISHCPKQAIEYGKHTIGLERYVCPKQND